MEKFKITDIRIENIFTNGLNGSYEGVTHTKALSTFSVVQAVEGSYEIGIDGCKMQSTGESGVFVAPADAVQKIVHHDGKEGRMKAQWIFFKATINGKYRLEDVFSFPIVLDCQSALAVGRYISAVRETDNYFEKIRAVYSLVEILISKSSLNVSSPQERKIIERYVQERYSERITAKSIAQEVFCSQTQVFRLVKRFFGLTPANYVNSVRMKNAERMLKETDFSIAEIALAVGVFDTAYFSKLFKKHYGESPALYRKNLSENRFFVK